MARLRSDAVTRGALRYAHVEARLTSHDERGVTDRDIRLGRAVSSIAAGAGVQLDSSSVSRLELALDTPAQESVLPFRAAVLAVEHQSGPGFSDSEAPSVWVLADPQGNRACLCTWQDRG